MCVQFEIHLWVYGTREVPKLIIIITIIPTYCRYVEGSDLLVCGSNNFYHYQDCKEASNYLCGDALNDVIAFVANQVGT